MAFRRDIVACSGGKDSTALALLLHDQGIEIDLFYTATGNEPPDVRAHIERVAAFTGAEVIEPQTPTLFGCIEQERMIPNFWARFCTRRIKIEPCIAFFASLPPHEHVLHVGLRADEPERVGIYDELVDRRFLLREIGWDVEDVLGFVRARGFEPPRRTDCMLCPFQGLHDWYQLWIERPEEFRRGCRIEARYGHTFRSPSRDTWPAALVELSYEFHRGRPIPKNLIDRTPCRVCTL